MEYIVTLKTIIVVIGLAFLVGMLLGFFLIRIYIEDGHHKFIAGIENETKH